MELLRKGILSLKRKRFQFQHIFHNLICHPKENFLEGAHYTKYAGLMSRCTTLQSGTSIFYNWETSDKCHIQTLEFMTFLTEPGRVNMLE